MAGTSLESFNGGSPVASLKQMTGTQQAILGGVFALVVGLIYYASQLGGSTSMGILYSDLEPEAAAGVVDQLESQGVEYELTNGGRVVWVPRQMVAGTRLDMSAAGLPDTPDGWSILDNQGITSSEFDQRVGYQRAMEGELASTIAVIDGVTSAKVHLVIPEQDLFVGDEVKASASVLIQTEGGASLTPGQVQAIVNLVGSSIEGLAPADVTVTDGAGRLLAGGDAEGLASMESDNQIRMREAFETDVETKLNALLAAIVGPGRSVVNVAADLDFDVVMTTQETFNESANSLGETLPQSETTRLEEYGSLGPGEEGVVDIETEILEGPDATGDGVVDYRLDERDVIYALDSITTSTERAPGAIRALSVAVAIDEEVIDPARLPEIQEIVSAAVGADLERGDLVAVNLLPFDISLEEQAALDVVPIEEPVEAETVDQLALVRIVAAAVIGALVLIIGLFMLRRATRRRVLDSVELAATTPAALPEAAQTEALPAVASAADENDLHELVANQPDDIAAVLRQWLSEPEPSR